MSICVIGGGLTGCLIAMELAESGKSVVLCEKAADLITRASLANEGKIHLGFVYAADQTFRTAKRMVDDALVFRPVLERWISSADFAESVYDSFDYLVPKNSMLDLGTIRRHFKSVSDYLKARTRSEGVSYLGQSEAHEFHEAESARPEMLGAFQTAERGVWPGLIARHLARSVFAHPSIEVRTEASVAAVSPAGGRWFVDIEGEEKALGPFDTVINCAWAARRELDARAGFHDGAEWFYRYKFAVVLDHASDVLAGGPPKNSTAILGSYGDSVYHAGEDALYCSWYPVGMCYSSSDLKSDARPDTGDARAAIENTWRGYANLEPIYHDVVRNVDWRRARVVGDFIAARARTDIDDPASLLHERKDHGPIELAPGYWSVETAKYTSAARCADECARRILGRV